MLAGERSKEDTLEAWTTLAGVYASSAALLTADWYEKQNEESAFSAGMDDDLAPEKLSAITDWVFAGPQLPWSRAKVAAHRLVFDAARRTVFVNVAEEGVAMARHESAKSCHGCIASATVDPITPDNATADVEQFFHPTCEGLFVPVRKEVYEPPGYTQEWRLRREEARNAGNISTEDVAKWLSAH